MGSLKVAIIGAGIGGLTAAAALRRRGVEVEVYEQARALGDVGAGIALAPNGWQLLERIGAMPEIDRLGSALDQGYFQLREDGSHISTLRPVGVPPERRVIGIHRADLITAIAGTLPQDVIHTGHRLASLAQDADGVTLQFDNGVTARADAVIGADGIHSVVRPYVVDEVPPVPSGTAAYRALVPVTSDDDWDWGTSKMWTGPGKHFLVYAIRANQLINVVAVVQAHGGELDSWSAPGDPAKLAEEFRGWDPVVERLITRVTDTFQWGLFDRAPLATWVNDRVALLGDAAHAMLPHLGQGGTQTVEDGFALAAALEDVGSDGVGEALLRYEQLRYDRATAVQQTSREAGELYDSDAVHEYESRDDRIRRLAPFYAWLNSHDADSLIVPDPAPAR